MDRKALLLELINATNQSDLTPEQVSFQDPVSQNSTFGTKVIADGVGVVKGSVEVEYNRVSGSSLFSGVSVTVGVPRGDVGVEAVLANIKARYGIELTSVEWDWVFDSNTKQGTLTPKAPSLYWRPNPISVRVVYHLKDISGPTQVLTGFEYQSLL